MIVFARILTYTLIIPDNKGTKIQQQEKTLAGM